jgi:hypothetical protein
MLFDYFQTTLIYIINPICVGKPTWIVVFIFHEQKKSIALAPNSKTAPD